MGSAREHLVERYEQYIAACNERRYADLEHLVAEDVGGSTSGRRAYVDGVRAVVTGFSDYRWQVEQLIVEDPEVAVRLTGRGTHDGEFRGVPASGRVVVTQELALYRFEGDRIVECWGDLGSTVRDALVSDDRV